MIKNLKKYRVANNMTQAQLSKLIGYDQTMISQWEHGGRDPNTDTLLKIAKIFNVSTDELVGYDKNYSDVICNQNLNILDLSKLPATDVETINAYLSLSPSLKDKANSYVTTLADVDKDFILKKIR